MSNRALVTDWKRAAVAAFAAYALVLQALLLSFGGAREAAALPGPQAFICAPSHEAGSDHAPAKSHDGLCCVFGCHGAGSAGQPPAIASVERPVPGAAILEPLREAALFSPDSNVLPVGSRAPPRLG